MSSASTSRMRALSSDESIFMEITIDRMSAPVLKVRNSYYVYAPEEYLRTRGEVDRNWIGILRPGEIVVLIARFKSSTEEGVALVLGRFGLCVVYGGAFTE